MNNKYAATFTARVILGIILLMQGYGKVFVWGVDNLYSSEMFIGDFKDLLPNWIIYFTAYFTSYVELIGGCLLVFGLGRQIVLYLVALVLIVVSFGHGLTDYIWDLSDVMYRLILLLFLLVVPKEWDKWALDRFIIKRKTPQV